MNEEPLSNFEREQIKKEIKGIINNLIVGCETLDMELAFDMFSDTPDFLMMETGGALCDYQTYVNNNINYLTTCSSFKLTTRSEEIRVINRDVAIFAWSYQVVATLKTGEQDSIENAGASFVFNRVADEWKVVYYHESTLPPVRIAKEET